VFAAAQLLSAVHAAHTAFAQYPEVHAALVAHVPPFAVSALETCPIAEGWGSPGEAPELHALAATQASAAANAANARLNSAGVMRAALMGTTYCWG
jgi:hypothetical protein